MDLPKGSSDWPQVRAAAPKRSVECACMDLTVMKLKVMERKDWMRHLVAADENGITWMSCLVVDDDCPSSSARFTQHESQRVGGRR